jgi:hypothetical protein
VIGVSILIHNILQLNLGEGNRTCPSRTYAHVEEKLILLLYYAADAHYFSMYLIIPFIAVTAALLKHNWYLVPPLAHAKPLARDLLHTVHALRRECRVVCRAASGILRASSWATPSATLPG